MYSEAVKVESTWQRQAARSPPRAHRFVPQRFTRSVLQQFAAT